MNAPDHLLSAGELLIDVHQRRARMGRRWLTLTDPEFDLLCLLARQPDKCVRADYLCEHLPAGSCPTRRTLDAHAVRLRMKLRGGRRNYIFNYWGVGYRLLAPEPDG